MSELGDLLELVHGHGERRYCTARGRLRIWNHHARAMAAFRAEAERRGGSIQTYAAGSGEEPQESTDELAFWLDGERMREERGERYAVAVGQTWWHWEPRRGAETNAGDQQWQHSVADEPRAMLEPAGLLGLLRFAPAGRGEVAGHEAVLASGLPRGEDPLGPHLLHHLGSGADAYRLGFEARRGVLLSSCALRAGQPFRRLELVELELDVPIDEGVFVFEPPAGEEVKRAPGGPWIERVSVTEAQRRAPFTVLIPDRIPEGWHANCRYAPASDRYATSDAVFLNYRSDSAHQDLSVSLYPLAGRPDQYELMKGGEGWEQVDGVSVRAGGSQAQAWLEREGTFAFLTSETLSRDELLAMARRLVPAPSEDEL